MDEYTTSQIALPLVVNYISSVTVVLANKGVTKQWPFGYTLTCIHFLTTFLVLVVFCYCGLFQYKKLSILSVAELAFIFTSSIVFNNLSIQHNTVCLALRSVVHHMIFD